MIVEFPYIPDDGPQTLAHQTRVKELLYGGAAGGGKSKFSRSEAIIMCMRVPGLRAIIFRRTFPDLERSVAEELLKEIPQSTATYNSTKHLWKFKNGSILELGHLSRKDDTLKYQGAEYQLIIFEEATHFTFYMFDYMRSRLRAGGEVAELLAAAGEFPRMVLTANPGGVGHHWVKKRFVDPAPPMTAFRPKPTAKQKNPGTRMYIPAKASDNTHVNEEYKDDLEALAPNLRKALRDGDWNVLDGVRFPDFAHQVHVIRPSDLPINPIGYPRAIGVDYGLSAPFAALWGAKLSDNLIVIYRELYKAGLTPREQAKLIRESEAEGEREPDRPIPLVLDPSMWAKSVTQPGAHKSLNADTPPPGSIASYYRDEFGGGLVKARNERVGGWALVEDQMRVRDDGYPRLLIYDTCVELIRTLPALPRDAKNPDDVDTHAEDHLPDALRYLLQHLVGRPPMAKRSIEDRRRDAAHRPVMAKAVNAKW